MNTTDATRLLIVEDDPGLQRQLKWALDSFEVEFAATRPEALVAVRRLEPAIVLQDLGLPPDPDGVEEGFATIAEVLQLAPATKIIVVTGREGREHALRAIGMGAYDFCQKPVDMQVLALILDRARRIHSLELENQRLAASRPAHALDGVIGTSEPMMKVCRLVQKLAPTQATVLLLGESGTGKELLAQALHALSARASRPMVAINCAAIPENLLESELFGYERGAFTGAVKQTRGKIEMADGGTLFLDEIGDMPLALQAKLLRFLQERVIERVGGRELIQVDVRIVAATHRDLKAEIAAKSFREDLYYRISEVAVTIPPLRERGADAVLIANYLLQSACRRQRRPVLKLAPEAIAAIDRYPWPGNVRELENRINAAAIMAEGKMVTAEDLTLQNPADGTHIVPLREVRQRAERDAVTRAMAFTGGNISKAAELLGVTRPTLYDIIERSGKSAHE
ncbi:MAG: PEP-CTERM-box response regulator transcription factor [Pseudomonadota bacterium]|jgi:two-component system NtrC family response regulator|nr:PEP-CTERM-box response regulator transcription factor [Pseudomonadota bacterium]